MSALARISRLARFIDGRHLVSQESRRRPNTTNRAEVNRNPSGANDIDCPMHIELTSILDQFDRVQARVHRLADNLTETRWAERADPARWSVAECVAHLNLTGRAYLPLLREALEEASSRDEPRGLPRAQLVAEFDRIQEETGGACARGRRAPDQSRLGDFSVRSAPAIQLVFHIRDPA